MLLLTLTLGAFLSVTFFAADGIATNDTVLTQPKTDTDTNTSEAPQSPEDPSVNISGQPVVTVTPAAPVITSASQTIVSKQNSQLVAPEVAGFKVNADGTLTGQDVKGKEVTLPKTGEASTAILTFVGTFFLALAVLLGFKKRA